MAGRLATLFTEAPAGVHPASFRSYVLLAVGTASAFAIHLVVTVLCWMGGILPMVAVNLAFCLPAYAVAFALNHRGRHATALAICVVELCVHQLLMAYYVGEDAGLQYFLLVVPSVAFSLTRTPRWVRMLLSVPALATFIAIVTIPEARDPVYHVDAEVLTMANVGSIATAYLLLGWFAYHYARAADSAEGRVRVQFDRAESLLHNILPVPIAERLKRDGGIISDGFADATVLFADLVGFTQMASSVPPDRVVGLLDAVFRAFDDLVERRGLEKIKTIGDAYMVAAGIPEPRADHAEAMADLAIEMLDATHRVAREQGMPLEIRIGMNSGPVVAGVIGRRKFIYDLWGDTVNLASRMESHGLPGRVQCTRATRDLLGDRFVFESRGVVPIKDKGAMEVFLLVGRTPRT